MFSCVDRKFGWRSFENSYEDGRQKRGHRKKTRDKVGQSVLGNHKTHYYYSIYTD